MQPEALSITLQKQIYDHAVKVQFMCQAMHLLPSVLFLASEKSPIFAITLSKLCNAWPVGGLCHIYISLRECIYQAPSSYQYLLLLITNDYFTFPR